MRRSRTKRVDDISEAEWLFLFDRASEITGRFGQIIRWALDAGIACSFVPSGLTARELWQRHGASVLAQWTRDYPGTRPSSWWKFAAPEPRKRLGGGGEAYAERSPQCERRLGVPANWNSYPGNIPINPDDPPLFESQAAYLDRHGLLLPGERKRLGKADFVPEPVTAIFDFGEAA